MARPFWVDDNSLDPPSNVAAAVHPELTYVLVDGADGDAHGSRAARSHVFLPAGRSSGGAAVPS